MTGPDDRSSAIEPMAASPRIGFARLTKMAFDGVDLEPLWQTLLHKVTDGTAEAGDAMDLSLIAQLRGLQQVGLDIQEDVLARHRLFLSPCASKAPSLRVLALAAAIDMGGNTPIDFLLEESGIELSTLYIVPGTEPPSPLPAHDVAIVVASESGAGEGALTEIEKLAPHWPKPMLNPPQRVRNLNRDKLYHLLSGIEGIDIPSTLTLDRSQLRDVAQGNIQLSAATDGTTFPVIARPCGSHAGKGLTKLDDVDALSAYLDSRTEDDFFVSRFVDYSDADGFFRKYRIVAVDGRFFPCHMAIADQWDIWYLNAGMSFSEDKRREEGSFMTTFDAGFAARHHHALGKMVERIGLDYFTVDCAQNKRGELLIFEADNTAVVHNMDSPDLFPYKPPQMRAIFEAFAAMMAKHAAPVRHPDSAAR